MNFVRCEHTFSHRDLLSPTHSDVPHLPVKKPIPTGEETSAKNLIFRPTAPNDRTTRNWTAIAWPTYIQSRKPDGKFGPANQLKYWNDCWFLAALAAVANDKDGHQILAESIKKVSIEGINGYSVTFAGLPYNPVFISDRTLDNCLDTSGGDADTRLVELAADRFFSVNGNFKFLYVVALLKTGVNPAEIEECFRQYCEINNVRNPMTYNPMLDGGHDAFACFMFTGMYPERLIATQAALLQENDITGYLNRYVANDRDGASVVFNVPKNSLGDTRYATILVAQWDVIRTDITHDGRLNRYERYFLNTLKKWLKTPDDHTRQALHSAAGNLRLQHINPVRFVNLLDRDQIAFRQSHRDLLRSGVEEVLAGGPGYIGLPGRHCGTIEGINTATNTFTYSEPIYPTLVHTGELSGLIQAIRFGDVYLSAIEPPTGRNDGERFEHAGTSRGRHLKQIHHQIVRDGKIDHAESNPLANLMAMDDGVFRQVYDQDNNGVIESGELKAVQLRVDRWVEHLELTSIW